MIWLKFLNKLIKILNQGATPKQIAGGLAFGMIIGLTPSFLLNLLFFFLLLLINVNIGMAILSMAVFKILAYPLDPLANLIGYQLLVRADWLKGLWTSLYNMPIVPFTKFNNTIVLGSLVIGLFLFIPVIILGARGVVYYRQHLMEKISNSKIVKLIKLSPVYGLYDKISNFMP